MINAVKVGLIELFMSALIKQLDGPTMKKFIDAGLDVIEDAIEKSETTLDDKVGLPLITQIRAVFEIPDNDDERLSQ